MDVSKVAARRSVRIPVRRLLVTLLRILDDWAFRDLDARARAQGWQVRRPAPLMRVYRASGLRVCSACAGEGLTRRGVCANCFGTGRSR